MSEVMALVAIPPPCLHCGKPSRKVWDYAAGPSPRRIVFKWTCDDCSAYVGCYNNSDKPLGFPADKMTRRARFQLHTHMDKLWRSGKATRSEVYAALAKLMGLAPGMCHVGMFTMEQCDQARKLFKRKRNGNEQKT